MKVYKVVLASCVLACVGACAAFRRAGYTAAGAAGGALAGASVGGPVGAAVGGAAGAVAANAVGENDELRSGGLIGEDALRKQNESLRLAIAELQGRPPTTVAVPQPFIPHWIWWALAGALLWLKGHHLWRLFNGGGLAALIRVVLPSWVGTSKKKDPS